MIKMSVSKYSGFDGGGLDGSRGGKKRGGWIAMAVTAQRSVWRGTTVDVPQNP
jgi:hypothetical protein